MARGDDPHGWSPRPRPDESVLRVDKFVKALDNLEQGFHELNAAWGELTEYDDEGPVREALDTDYPFAESFDELTLRVATWRKNVLERLKPIMEREAPR